MDDEDPVEKILWNITLFILSITLAVCGIQHAAFFYTGYPDPSRLVPVPITNYFWLGVLIFAMFKVSFYAEWHGRIFQAMRARWNR